MISIEDTPIYDDIQRIFKSGKKDVFFNIKAKIHYDDETIDIFKVLSIDLFRDYESNYADSLNIEVMIPLGKWAKKLYPNRHKLELSIYKTPAGEASDTVDTEDNQVFERFKAFPEIKNLPSIEGRDLDSHSEDALDMKEIITVTFTLQTKSLEKLRLLSIGSIFRQCTNEDVLRICFQNSSNAIELSDGKPVDFVDIVKTNNEQKREHINVPPGTPLVGLPDYLQTKQGGVYNSGINTYFQNNGWWIYPLYNTEMFEDDKRHKLVIFKVTKARSLNVERTFSVEGDVSYILASGNADYRDDSESTFVNEGNGFRLTRAENFLSEDTAIKVTNNKASMSRGKNLSELVMSQREDKVNYAPHRGISDNALIHYSELAKRNGAIATIDWQNSDSSIIIPGMSVKYYYLDNKGLVETNGIVLGARHFTELDGEGINTNRYISNSKIILFLKKVKK